MLELVPDRVERRIAQAEVGSNVDNLAALLKQRRHQVHGLATGQRHQSHVGFAPDAFHVQGDHFLVHKVPQIRIQTGHGAALLRLGGNVHDIHLRMAGQQPHRLGAAVT